MITVSADKLKIVLNMSSNYEYRLMHLTQFKAKYKKQFILINMIYTHIKMRKINI